MKESKTNCGVYKITNLIPDKETGICKVYIGSSSNLYKRKYDHFRLLINNKHHCCHLQSAVNIDGIENFKWEVIKYIPKIEDKSKLKEMLIECENLEMEQYKNEDGTINHSTYYNMCLVAESCLGRRWSEESKKKLSKAKKGKKHTKEQNMVKSARMIGHIVSEETIKKIVETRTRNNSYAHSEESKNKIGKGNKGKVRSEESKKKMSTAQKGVDNGFYGRKHSEESKKKMGESAKKRPPLSSETRDRMNKSKCKKVINATTGKIFNSVKEASEFYHIPNSCISRACRREQKTTGSYRWMYL